MPAAQTARAAAQKKTLIASEQDAQARTDWRELITELVADDLLFLDETSTQIVMTRPRARAARGVRVYARVPRNHGEHVTCLAARSPLGVVAPLAFEGALDGPIFAPWVQEWLVPELHAGQTVVLDHLSVHKHAAARAAIEAVGCRVCFLPPYSPDFNPIEVIFAKLNTALRGTAARTFSASINALDAAFTTITAADARACFRHGGDPLMLLENQSP